MSRLTCALAGASALALTALTALPGAAAAQGMPSVHAVVGGGYAHSEVFGVDIDGWGANGTAIIGGSNGFGGEATVGYASLSGGGIDIDGWNVGGAAFYRTMDYALGGGVEYNEIEVFGTSFNATQFGVAGEAYLSDMFTLGANGGYVTGSFNTDGFFVGGTGTLYVTPNVAFGGHIDYVDVDGGDTTTYGAGLEVLPFQTMPITLKGSIDHYETGGIDYNVWGIGLTLYLGTPGDGTLVSNHRNGGVVLSRGVDLRF